MRELINIDAFYQIHRSKEGFHNPVTNMEMRVYLSGYGFKATRANTQTLMNLR